MKRVFFAVLLIASLAGCGVQVGNAPELHQKEVASFQHGHKNVVNYALNLLAAMVTERIKGMSDLHDSLIAQALASGDAAKVLSLERSYQAHVIALEDQVKAEFDKIARMEIDFEHGSRLGEVVQKALENKSQVDWNKVVDLIVVGVEGSGLDLGPLTKALKALQKARNLPVVTPTPVVPVEG